MVGADGEAIHLLFSDLSMRDYSVARGDMAGARWRDVSDEVPLAWGGDPTEPVFWALVWTDQLKSASTRSAVEAADVEETSGRSMSATGRLTLLELRGGRWRAIEAPKAAETGERFWIVGCRGRAWLFWQGGGGEVLAVGAEGQFEDEDEIPEAEPRAGVAASGPSTRAALARREELARRGAGIWSATESVCEVDDLCSGWAGEGPTGPLFIAGRGPDDGHVQLHIYAREDGAWGKQGAARDGTELLELDARVCGVCAALGHLFVARPAAKRGVEFGVGDLGPSPSVRFFALSLGREAAPESSGWRDTGVLALVLVLMTVVLWTRREQMTKPLALPPGLVLAPVSRRLLGTVVDAIPAMVVVMPFVMSVMPPGSWGFERSFWKGADLDAETQDKVVGVYLGFVLLYGVWCLLWELLLGTTPGKLLFGCRVLTTQITRPTARQILWRNALRVVEVGVSTPGWIVTLMMLVLLTRNRQRIGDLLAGTIVVTLGSVQPERPVDDDADRRPPPSS